MSIHAAGGTEGHRRHRKALWNKPLWNKPLWNLGLVVLSLVFLCGCSNGGASAAGSGAPGGGKGGGGKGGQKGMGGGDVPVTVATAAQKDVPVEIQVIGNVEAYSTITVKAQVGGQLTKVSFNEGDYVKKGELLFSIDRRPLE